MNSLEEVIKDGAKKGVLEYLSSRIKSKFFHIPRTLKYNDAMGEIKNGRKVILRVDNPMQWDKFKGIFPSVVVSSEEQLEFFYKILSEQLSDLPLKKIYKFNKENGNSYDEKILFEYFTMIREFLPDLEKLLSVVGYDSKTILDSSKIFIQPYVNEGSNLMMYDVSPDTFFVNLSQEHRKNVPHLYDIFYAGEDNFIVKQRNYHEREAKMETEEHPLDLKRLFYQWRFFSKNIFFDESAVKIHSRYTYYYLGKIRKGIRNILINNGIIKNNDLLEYEVIASRRGKEDYHIYLNQVRYLGKWNSQKTEEKIPLKKEIIHSTGIPLGTMNITHLPVVLQDDIALKTQDKAPANYLKEMMKMDSLYENGYLLIVSSKFQKVATKKYGKDKTNIYNGNITGLLQGKLPNLKAQVLNQEGDYGHITSIFLSNPKSLSFLGSGIDWGAKVLDDDPLAQEVLSLKEVDVLGDGVHSYILK